MLKHLSEHRPLFTRGFIILGIVLGVLLAGAATVAMSSTVRIGVVQTTLSAVGADLPADENGFTNILLLGVGDEWHDAPDLTDTMIIASIDPGSTKSVVMVSLPRDLLIDTDTRSVSGRINAIYANEKRRLQIREKMTPEEAGQLALRMVADEIGKNTGITIHGVIKADFTAFTEVVDALGGVDIDVPEPVTDYTYPIAEDQVGLFQVDAGPQHFDGETALKYARSRHSSTDFDRSARQQLLLKAVAAQARELSILSQFNLALDVWDRLEDHVVTTFDTSQILGLARIGTELSLKRMITSQINYSVGGDGIEAAAGGFVYPAPPELYEGASVLLPLPLPGRDADWSQIQTYVQFLVHFRRQYLTESSLVVRSAGASSIQSWRLRNELLRYGWSVLPIEQGTGTGSTYSSVYFRDNDDEAVAEWMGHLLELPVARATDEQTGSGDIILNLGSDFRYQPFQTLSGAVLKD
jgi:LCP family protein required for cell wall assembly